MTWYAGLENVENQRIKCNDKQISPKREWLRKKSEESRKTIFF